MNTSTLMDSLPKKKPTSTSLTSTKDRAKSLPENLLWLNSHKINPEFMLWNSFLPESLPELLSSKENLLPFLGLLLLEEAIGLLIKMEMFRSLLRAR